MSVETEAGGTEDANQDTEIRVTWAELFFDLVFVFAITGVSGLLRGEQSWGGVLRALIVFVPVYWSWVGASIHANTHDIENAVDRVGVFAVGLGGLFMALALPGAYEQRGVLFAASYYAVRLILAGLVWRGCGQGKPRSRHELILTWVSAAQRPRLACNRIAGAARPPRGTPTRPSAFGSGWKHVSGQPVQAKASPAGDRLAERGGGGQHPVVGAVLGLAPGCAASTGRVHVDQAHDPEVAAGTRRWVVESGDAEFGGECGSGRCPRLTCVHDKFAPMVGGPGPVLHGLAREDQVRPRPPYRQCPALAGENPVSMSEVDCTDDRSRLHTMT